MASHQEVKQYLAHWFQLGRKVVLPSGKTVSPSRVFAQDHYSREFEQCWQQLTHQPQAYLEDTQQTIQELLSNSWQINDCARCGMPVPMIDSGISSLDCPCSELDTWPNQDLPTPRTPINSDDYLRGILTRLNRT